MKFPTSIWKDKTRDSLSWRSRCYFEAQVWKKDSNIAPSLFFSHFFYFLVGFFGLFYFYKVWSLIPTCGGVIVFIILSSRGQCSSNEDHHTFIYLQLNDYKLITRTKYDSIWMPPAVYRDMQWIKSDKQKLWMVALPEILCQLHDHAKQYDNDEACHSNGMVESCMAIYLGMAMEMPW